MNALLKTIVISIITITYLSCTDQSNNLTKEESMLESKINQYAKTEIKYDKTLLNERQKQVVQNIYKAAKIMDEIFLEQVYSKNEEILKSLEFSNDPIDELKLEYFNINFGPFDRLDHNKPFIGKNPKPLGANFYPEDMTKE